MMIVASFFDIDGTLTKGHMITRFAEYLTKLSLFSTEVYAKIDQLKHLFLAKKITYRQIAVEVPKLYAIGFKDRTTKEINQAAKGFASQIIKDSLYSYSVELVQYMKQYGLTVALSGSPQEVVQLVGNHLGFDLVYGTKIEVIDGVYTERLIRNLIRKEGKTAVFQNVVKEQNIDLKKSFGFGDTEQDASFLSKVGNPFAINPTPELLTIAKRNDWTICQSEDEVLPTIKK
jgi:HAD superfamily hydrolase (TIGR01490 family)